MAEAYYVQNTPDDWDGTTIRVVGPASESEPNAVVTFSRVIAYYHGMPNDEAFSGHPLYSGGLHPYGAFEVMESTWIARLMKMNRVHAYHRDEQFSDFRHFVLAFHDTTFECIALSYTISTGFGSVRQAASGAIWGIH